MSEQDVDVIYARVAKQFAVVIQKHFQSEETLKALHDTYFPGLDFDRTDRWHHILRRELRSVWREHGLEVKTLATPFDTMQILCHLHSELDFNLFTQVYLNVQPVHALSYSPAAANNVSNELEAKWEGKSPSPFDAKPKMFKAAATTEQQDYNRDLSTLKALNIIAKTTPFTAMSYRVSPIGSTPTLVDSGNLSMLGVGGDQFLHKPLFREAYYFTWDAAPLMLREGYGPGSGPNKYAVPDIPYLFTSKSGGDILNDSLFARKVTAFLFSLIAGDNEALLVQLVPRMNSVLMLAPYDYERMQDQILPKLKTLIHPDIELHVGVRRAKALPAA